MCDERQIGVVIEFANWEPFHIKSTDKQKPIANERDRDDIPSPAQEWRYRLFGHFDEMKISVTSDLNENLLYKKIHPRNFTHKSHVENVLKAISTSDDERMRYHPERSTIVLYTDHTNEKYKKLLEFAYADTVENYVAVVSLQFLRVFYDLPFSGQLECIEHFLDKFKAEQPQHLEFDFVVLNVLSLDDVCVLIKSRSVSSIIRCSTSLRQHACGYCISPCDCQCGRYEIINNNSENDNSFANKYSLYWEKLQRTMPETKINNRNLDRLCNDVRDFFYDRKRKAKTLNMNSSDDRVILEKLLNKLLGVIYEEKDFDKITKMISYVWLEWLIKCRKALRVAGGMPLVRETHTFIGSSIESLRGRVPKDLLHGNNNDENKPGNATVGAPNKAIDQNGTKEKYDPTTDKAEFVVLIKVHPGVDLDKCAHMFDCYIKNEFKFDDHNKNVQMRMGKHDLIYINSGQIDEVKRMTEIARCNRFLGTIDSMTCSPIIHIACSLIFDRQPNESENSMRTEIFKEHLILSEIWARERHKVATRLFSDIRKNTEKYTFLYDLVNDHDELYTKGVKRLYGTSVAYDYKSAACFFISFYDHVGEVCKLIGSSSKIDENKKFLFACEIRDCLELAYKRLLEFFNDRVVFDITARDNTRPSLYATGAYETLLNRYSVLVDDLRDLLTRVNDSSANIKLEALLLPIEYTDNQIKLQNLFPLVGGSKKLIFVDAPIDRMLDVYNTLPSLCHELGHHLCVIEIDNFITIFVKLYARAFADRLTKKLSNLCYAQVPETAVHAYTTKLFNDIKEYLMICINDARRNDNYVTAKGTNDLVKADALVYDSMIKALEKQVDDELPPESKPFHESIMALCNVLGVLPLVHKRNNVNILSVDAVDKGEGSLVKSLLEECYADIVMIRTLNLDINEYLKIVIPQLARSYNILTVNDNESLTVDSLKWEATRVLSALMHISSDSTPKLNENDTSTFLKSVGDYCTNAMESNNIGDFENNIDRNVKPYWNSIKSCLTALSNRLKACDLRHDQLWMWAHSYSYLYKNGETLSERLNQLIENKTREARILTNYRDLWNKIKSTTASEMDRLKLLLDDPEGWL